MAMPSVVTDSIKP